MNNETKEQLSLPKSDESKEEKKPPESGKKYEKPPTLHTVCSLSCSMPARDFVALLRKNSVNAVLDTRLTRNYRGIGFHTSEDDFRFLCELADVAYHVVESLAPTQELRDDLARMFKDPKKVSDRDPMAWTRFLEGYGKLLRERKPSRHSPLSNIIQGDYRVIAVVCACRHHDDCHRSMATGFMSTLFPEVELKILYPGDKAPPRASPRRYRLRDFPWAGLKAEKPEGGK